METAYESRRVSMSTFHRNFYQTDLGKLVTLKCVNVYCIIAFECAPGLRKSFQNGTETCVVDTHTTKKNLHTHVKLYLMF